MENTFIKDIFSSPKLVGSYIRLGINNRKVESFKQKFFKINEDIDKTIEEIEGCINKNSGCDIYIAPSTYESANAKKKSVNYITALYSDFDEYNERALKEMPKERADYCREEMKDTLIKLDILPSIIINSGNGLQVYWMLNEPVAVGDNTRVVEGALKELSNKPDGFKGDIAVTSLGHMMRMPGTYNTKDQNNIKSCRVVWEDTSNKYSFQNLVDDLDVKVDKEYNKGNYSDGSMYETYKSLNTSYEVLRKVASKCEFLVHLGKHPEDQGYMVWIHLAINLAVFGEDGRIIFHKISEKHAKYRKSESENIFIEALSKVKNGEYKPSSCSTICGAGFDCPKTCKQKTPAGMILSTLMKMYKSKRKNKNASPKTTEVDLGEEIENLVSKTDILDNIKLLEKFIEEKINPSDNSLVLKEVYLKKAMEKLDVPERGYLSSLKKQIRERASLPESSDNLFVEIGNEILNENELAFIGEELYRYQRGVWPRYPGNIDQLIVKKLGNYYSKKSVNNVRFYIETRSYVDISKVNNHKDENMICLSNGMLKVGSGNAPQLTKHSKDYYALNQLNIEYDPSATCPRWNSFLQESFSLLSEGDRRQTIEVIQEWFGYSLVAGNELHKMMLLIGKPRTGKGVIQEIYSTLLGQENISAIAIGQMDKEFNSIHLIDKLANVGPEIGENDKFNVAFVKSAIGEDLIAGRYLHKNLVSFRNNAKLLFASNHTPKILDRSDAMYERALCIPMDNVVPKAERNYGLKKELKEELPGILNWAIEGRIRLYKRGRFLESPSMIKLKMNIKERNNSVLHWFNTEKYELKRDKKYIVLKKLWDSYKDFCLEDGYKRLTRSDFKKELNNIEGVTIKRPSRPNQDCVFIDWEQIDSNEVGKSEKISDFSEENSSNEITTKDESTLVKTGNEISEFQTGCKTHNKSEISGLITETINTLNKDWAAFA